jgi:hypothetical protein
MHGDVLLFILLLMFGCAAFFFGVICFLCKLVAWIGRSLFGAFRPRRPLECGCSPADGRRKLVCPNERCRKLEFRDARYCSQCGTRLPSAPKGD